MWRADEDQFDLWIVDRALWIVGPIGCATFLGDLPGSVGVDVDRCIYAEFFVRPQICQVRMPHKAATADQGYLDRVHRCSNCLPSTGTLESSRIDRVIAE